VPCQYIAYCPPEPCEGQDEEECQCAPKKALQCPCLPENQPPVQPPEEPCEEPPCLDGYCLKLGVIVKVSKTTCEEGSQECECEKP